MNVLEIKNNLVKISYSAEDNLALSGFVIIEDANNPYVAQIMSIKADGLQNSAIVKLLFTFNEDGILKNYNGTIPSTEAKVSSLPAKELLDIIPADNPLLLGIIAQQDTPLKVDQTILENNLLICSNSLENTSNLLKNITSQIKNKTVIIDSEGIFDISNKVVFGKDFKLPLDYDTIDFIYENDLEDVDVVNKAIIQDIFIEVQNYVKTLPEKFLPFDTFVNVIDSQYRESQIPELILLKNKLLKYKNNNIFAQELKEILNLGVNIESQEFCCIDLSEVPDNIQKEVIRYIYKVLEDSNQKIYVFAKVNNSNITKKLLKTLIKNDKDIYTTVICPHEFKYIEEIKEISQNIIFFKPSTLTHDFASYNTYLNKLNSDEFIVYGAHTQNIPFIVECGEIEEPQVEETDTFEVIENNNQEMFENGIQDSSEDFDGEDLLSEESDESDLEDSNNLNEINEDSFEVFEGAIEEKSDESILNEIVEEPKIDESYTEENNNIDDDIEKFEPVEIVEEDYSNANYIEEFPSEEENVEIIEESVDQNFENEEINSSQSEPIIEVLEPDNVYEPMVNQQELSYDVEPIEESDYLEIPDEQVVEYNDDSFEQTESVAEDENVLVEQIAKDVDKAFYEKLPSEDDSSDVLTEDDLNIIEDLASDDIPLAGDVEYDDTVIEEDLPPVVPIYPADDIEEREEGADFVPGDRVSTAKYGEGVVEKMVKYGNKMLCSIDFPNIGRRLLDPAMTEITRIM